jgi:cytidyltransferase-like protein
MRSGHNFPAWHVFRANASEVEFETSPVSPQRKKVIVTGCYDCFHSGHVRFFEEASALGDLYVVVGRDARHLRRQNRRKPSRCQRKRVLG